MDRFLVRLKGLLIFCYIIMAIAEWIPNNIINEAIEIIFVIICCLSAIVVAFFAIYSGFNIAKMIISGEE